MSFREKKAWVTMIALIVVFLPYYYFMVLTYHQPDPNFITLGHMALTALVIFIVLECVLILVTRFLSPEDAAMPRDERDQLFAFRASRVAYISLIALIIAVTFPMIHMHAGNWGWGMLYLAAIILAEILREIALILQYRRGY